MRATLSTLCKTPEMLLHAYSTIDVPCQLDLKPENPNGHEHVCRIECYV